MSEYTNPPSKMLITALVAVTVIGGFVVLMNDMAIYNEDISSSPLTNNISDQEETLRNTGNLLSSQTTEEGAISEGDSLIGLVYKGLQNMWNTVKDTFIVIPKIGTAVSEQIGIPPWFTAAIVTIILIMSSAAIIKVITGREL